MCVVLFIDVVIYLTIIFIGCCVNKRKFRFKMLQI